MNLKIKSVIMVGVAAVVGLGAFDAYAWNWKRNKNKGEAKESRQTGTAVAKDVEKANAAKNAKSTDDTAGAKPAEAAAPKAENAAESEKNEVVVLTEKEKAKFEKQKKALKTWCANRYQAAKVKDLLGRKGKVTTLELYVKCHHEEMQSIVDTLLASYVILVNTAEAYADYEEGIAMSGVVLKKMSKGMAQADAEASLPAAEKAEYDKYLNWLRNGKNPGVVYTLGDLLRIGKGVATLKKQMDEVVKSFAKDPAAADKVAKDVPVVTELAESVGKGVWALQGVLRRERGAKKLIGVEEADDEKLEDGEKTAK